MEDDDSDAEMADYGTDFSDDVDPNFDASSLPGHSRIGNRTHRIPRFPGFQLLNGGDFPIPRADSRVPVAGNPSRDSGT